MYDGRWDQGMSTERYHPWHTQHLVDEPVAGAEAIAGAVALISIYGSSGMTYEQCEPVNNHWHRVKASGPVPNVVRPA